MKRWTVNFLVTTSIILTIALSILWIRSYENADRLHGRIWGRRSFVIASKEGYVTIVGFMSHGHPNWWTWSVHSYPVDDEMSFPVGPTRQYVNRWGFGTIDRPFYSVMRSIQETPQGKMMLFGAASATLNGSGVLVPFWFLMLLALPLPLIFVRHWFYRRRARKPGLCARCGYDLRASQERCPECGEPIEPGSCLHRAE